MKRVLLSILILTLTSVPARAQQPQPFNATSPFYPLKVGNTWTYRSGKQQVVITVEKQGELFAIKEKDKETEKSVDVVASRLSITSGEQTLTENVGVYKDGVYRFTSAGKAITPPLRFLKLEQTPGPWDVDVMSEDVRLKGSFTAQNSNVSVPAGTFQALQVTSQDFQIGSQKMSITYWFVPNIGMVKEQVQIEAREPVILEMERFEEGK